MSTSGNGKGDAPRPDVRGVVLGGVLYPFQYETLWRLYEYGGSATAADLRRFKGPNEGPRLRVLRERGLVEMENTRPRATWRLTAAGIRWIEAPLNARAWVTCPRCIELKVGADAQRETTNTVKVGASPALSRRRTPDAWF